MTRYYTVKKFTVDTVSWTAITVPVGCSCTRITIENGTYDSDFKLRTDSADSNTETTIPNGSMKTIGGEAGHVGTQFSPGDIIAYIQAISGTGPAIVEFVR